MWLTQPAPHILKKSLSTDIGLGAILNPNEKVEGVAILLLENKLNEFIEKWEKGYEKLEVSIIANNEEFKAYTCISYQKTELLPSEEYRLFKNRKSARICRRKRKLERSSMNLHL